ncbi:hypothetical protein ISG33_14570 [Glaciecola sp. MH2013]|uniref:hypothetical protein n=1 Tax=Glaciecola sp. MH2013 TaxID=2785524 RepID=UPI00189CA661|nr:hypothetical protein [Glaciecola sp. MH2013]MBF7074627.1 hypothetical protein [Glaciecola sp. MH2013]
MHSLFLDDAFEAWRDKLSIFADSRWYSLIVELDSKMCPTEDLKSFDEPVYSRVVFRKLNAPNYITTKEIMLVFTISDSNWSSVIWHSSGVKHDI